MNDTLFFNIVVHSDE